MKLAEICKLTPDSLAQLLAERHKTGVDAIKKGRRALPRWPFLGTVELWVPEKNGEERYTLATSLDLSTAGIGIRHEESLAPGTYLSLAIHEPEVSLHGKAVVAHCTEIECEYLIGLRFIFDSD